MISSGNYVIDGSRETIMAALQEADRFAKETGLTDKQALQFRLLAEELLGVVNGAAKVRDGSFVMEWEDGAYRLCLSARTFPIGEVAQRKLLDASSSGENDLHQGLAGKLRMVADWYAKGGDRSACQNVGGGFSEEASDEWSLARLRNQQAREKKAQKWDALETSVLNHLADDVRVGLRREKVSITVLKKFHHTSI